MNNDKQTEHNTQTQTFCLSLSLPPSLARLLSSFFPSFSFFLSLKDTGHGSRILKGGRGSGKRLVTAEIEHRRSSKEFKLHIFPTIEYDSAQSAHPGPGQKRGHDRPPDGVRLVGHRMRTSLVFSGWSKGLRPERAAGASTSADSNS